MITELPGELAAALADDAKTLALLLDREINGAMLLELRRIGFPGSLALAAAGEAIQAHELMSAAMAALPDEIDPATLDELAADYAAIFLNGSFGASPSESVWLSDDHLICQDAMFEIRRIYAAKGVAAPDWRSRPDDHLTFQLQFVGYCLHNCQVIDDCRELAVFLDEHPLRWLGDFARRVASRCDTAFYAALCLLTAAWTNQLRDLLANLLDEPRPTAEEVAARFTRQRDLATAVPLAFMPGLAPTL